MSRYFTVCRIISFSDLSALGALKTVSLEAAMTLVCNNTIPAMARVFWKPLSHCIEFLTVSLIANHLGLIG